MMPAMAAAGPARAVPTRLDGCSCAVGPPEICGDNAACGDFCSALPVMSM